MEVKIGVQHAPRELVIESSQSAEELESIVQAALSDEHGLVGFTDERGRRILVPVARLAYVEIGEQRERRVGFGPM